MHLFDFPSAERQNTSQYQHFSTLHTDFLIDLAGIHITPEHEKIKHNLDYAYIADSLLPEVMAELQQKYPHLYGLSILRQFQSGDLRFVNDPVEQDSLLNNCHAIRDEINNLVDQPLRIIPGGDAWLETIESRIKMGKIIDID